MHFILSKSEPIQTIKLNGDDLCKKDSTRESDPIQSSNNIADWEFSLLNNLCPIDGWCFSWCSFWHWVTNISFSINFDLDFYFSWPKKRRMVFMVGKRINLSIKRDMNYLFYISWHFNYLKCYQFKTFCEYKVSNKGYPLTSHYLLR